MADVELLPLPWIERYSVVGDIAYPVSSDPDGDYVAHDDHTAAMQAYARANVAHATASKDAEIEALRAEVGRLRTDLMESDEIREKLGHILTRTAAALKGDPPAGVWHSWHDLPEKAAHLVGALRELVAVFSESGMYDEEVFAKAREALDRKHEKENGND